MPLELGLKDEHALLVGALDLVLVVLTMGRAEFGTLGYLELALPVLSHHVILAYVVRLFLLLHWLWGFGVLLAGRVGLGPEVVIHFGTVDYYKTKQEN